MSLRHASASLATLLVLCLPLRALRADVITTTSGGRISGKIVSETDSEIRVRTDQGQLVTIPRSEIDTITKEKPDEVYAKRAKKLADDDVKGLTELAKWARDNKLEAQATECWQRVLKADADNGDARDALGWGKVDGKWYQGDDLKRAQGLVERDGKWVSPGDKGLLDAGFVKKGDRWITKEEADQEAGGSGESRAGTEQQPEKPEKPEKPQPAPRAAEPKPAAKSEPVKPAAPAIDLPADDKELLKLVSTGKPDEKRLEALKALAAKGDSQQAAAKAEVERLIEVEKKNVLDYLKKDKGTVRTKMAALVVDRRAAALDFIMDPSRYPDANHGAAAQPEVDKLVGALRRAWQDPLHELLADKGDKKVRVSLDEIKKLAGWSRDVFSATVDVEKIEDDLSVEADRIIQTSKLPVDDKDAQILAYSWTIMKWNGEQKTSMGDEEKACLLATNEYRIMLGVKALKVFEPLVQAARKHSKEMVDLKYFEHSSPTPENASPSMRCAREGAHYLAENIAFGSTSGRSTFMQWYTSSGHHRNILGKGQRSIGIGAYGNHWTQDFGADDP